MQGGRGPGAGGAAAQGRASVYCSGGAGGRQSGRRLSPRHSSPLPYTPTPPSLCRTAVLLLPYSRRLAAGAVHLRAVRALRLQRGRHRPLLHHGVWQLHGVWHGGGRAGGHHVRGGRGRRGYGGRGVEGGYGGLVSMCRGNIGRRDAACGDLTGSKGKGGVLELSFRGWVLGRRQRARMVATGATALPTPSTYNSPLHTSPAPRPRPSPARSWAPPPSRMQRPPRRLPGLRGHLLPVLRHQAQPPLWRAHGGPRAGRRLHQPAVLRVRGAGACVCVEGGVGCKYQTQPNQAKVAEHRQRR